MTHRTLQRDSNGVPQVTADEETELFVASLRRRRRELVSRTLQDTFSDTVITRAVIDNTR